MLPRMCAITNAFIVSTFLNRKLGRNERESLWMESLWNNCFWSHLRHKKRCVRSFCKKKVKKALGIEWNINICLDHERADSMDKLREIHSYDVIIDLKLFVSLAFFRLKDVNSYV